MKHEQAAALTKTRKVMSTKTMDRFVIPIGPLTDADRAKTYRDALKVLAAAGIDTQPGRTAHLQARSMSAWAQGVLDALNKDEEPAAKPHRS